MFKKRIIPKSDNIFVEIKEIRQNAGVSIKTLSKATKIPTKHLKNLEEGSKELLPDILYTKNIIKKYLNFFNIDSRPYIKNIKLIHENNGKPKIALKAQKLLVLPRIIKASIIGIIILLFLIYLGFTIKKIFDPPYIEIYSPTEGETVKQSIIDVKGKTSKGVLLTLNDQEVILNKNGEFDVELSLQKGLNLIKITGIKRYSKENTIWRNVILEIN